MRSRPFVMKDIKFRQDHKFRFYHHWFFCEYECDKHTGLGCEQCGGRIDMGAGYRSWVPGWLGGLDLLKRFLWGTLKEPQS